MFRYGKPKNKICFIHPKTHTSVVNMSELLSYIRQDNHCSDPIVTFKAYLLLVLPLGVKACLDAFPGLLKGLPLGALSRVMGAHTNNVGAGENQNVGYYL